MELVGDNGRVTGVKVVLTELGEPGLELVLEKVSGVIGGQGDAHEGNRLLRGGARGASGDG